VIKGIPLFAELLDSADPTISGEPVGVFVSGDDAAAKRVGVNLMSSLPRLSRSFRKR